MIEVRITMNEVRDRLMSAPFPMQHRTEWAWANALRQVLREKGVRLRPKFGGEFSDDELEPPWFVEMRDRHPLLGYWIVRQWAPDEDGAPK